MGGGKTINNIYEELSPKPYLLSAYGYMIQVTHISHAHFWCGKYF